MSKQAKRFYDAEFKERAVKLAIESGSPGEVSKNLGVNRRTLYGWIKRYHQGGPSSVQVDDEHVFDEVKRLRKENARLKEERDILKKAAAYFAVNSR